MHVPRFEEWHGQGDHDTPMIASREASAEMRPDM